MRPTSLQRLVDLKGNEYLRDGDETRNTTSHFKGKVTRGTFTWSTGLACGQAIRTDAVAAIGEGYC